MTGGLSFFDELGHAVAAEWRRADYDWRAFPVLAAAQLRAFDAPLDYRSIVEWLAGAVAIPYQANATSGFGQPPVVVFWHPRFYVEALFWSTGATAVHNHAFAGAFRVLDGSCFQATYAFECDDEVTPQFRLGTLTVRGCGVLARGAVEAIVPGENFVHATCHRDVPTVTLVVRTATHAFPVQAWEYFRPHVAIEPFCEDHLALRHRQLLDLSLAADPAFYASVADTLLASADALTGFRVLRHAFNVRHRVPEAYARVGSLAEARFGGRFGRLLHVLEEMARTARLTRAFDRIRDGELRSVLALAMCLDDPGRIADELRLQLPHADGSAVVQRCSELLRKIDPRGEADQVLEAIGRMGAVVG